MLKGAQLCRDIDRAEGRRKELMGLANKY